jgi:hypothetical protein
VRQPEPSFGTLAPDIRRQSSCRLIVAADNLDSTAGTTTNSFYVVFGLAPAIIRGSTYNWEPGLSTDWRRWAAAAKYNSHQPSTPCLRLRIARISDGTQSLTLRSVFC